MFPLLALPRELRDEIYSHIIGSRLEDSTMMFDSVRTQAHNHFRPRRSRRHLGEKHSKIPILFANQQLHQETMETVFRQNTFLVTMDLRSPVLRSQTKHEGDEQAAIPLGWDLSKIRSMSLRLDLGPRQGIMSALKSFQFHHMMNMQKLSVLRLVVTVWDLPYPLADDSPIVFLEDAINYDEAKAFRTMLRDLRDAIPDSVRKLNFGLSHTSDEMKPAEWGFLRRSGCCFPGERLRAIFEELPKSENLSIPGASTS